MKEPIVVNLPFIESESEAVSYTLPDPVLIVDKLDELINLNQQILEQLNYIGFNMVHAKD